MLFQVHEYLKPTARAGKKKRHTLVCSVGGCSWAFFQKQLPKIAPKSEWKYEFEALEPTLGLREGELTGLRFLDYFDADANGYRFKLHFKVGQHATAFMLVNHKIENTLTDYKPRY